MLEEVNRLTSLLEGLLTLSRAEAEQFVIRPSVFPLKELMQEVGDLLEVLVEEKRLVFQIQGDETGCVKADRLYLRQAVVNLLHNAVKFSPAEGSIVARIERRENSTVVLSISDTRPGIPRMHAEKVFKRFYRVEESRGGENKGAGLGLSIAKWAVQANHGEIGLDSSSQGGCTFWIRLPTVPCGRPQ